MDPTDKAIDDESEFAADAIELALSFALLAPSPRNIQPWAFASDAGDGMIDLFLDRDRSRPVADPDGRELTISCGVALYFVRLALASLGAAHVVTMFPSPSKVDHLAKIRLTGEIVEPDERARELVASDVARHTNWHEFALTPVLDADLDELVAVASEEGAQLRVAAAQERSAIEKLVASASHLQLEDPDFVSELERWPTGRPASPDLASQSVATEAARETLHGVVVALSTVGDTPIEWVLAGQALARVLLTATGLGLAVAFVNQPIQVAQTRGEVAAALGLNGDVQQLLRVGYVDELADETPRRSLDEVLAPLSEPW